MLMINLSCFVQLVQSSSPITQQGMMDEKQVDYKDIVKENLGRKWAFAFFFFFKKI